MMDEESWIYGNGTFVEGPGQYIGNGIFNISTSDADLGGSDHVTYLRGCSRLGEFLELGLNI